ncbi:hypothetical protein EHQ68_09370 [Leptospira congkakensis]|uniref:IPT/TIG domain-containing protein n=2 Tax=Leptospira congkakensis TaxID=2484932 RepID=A0A4Z1ADU3_9LEPT|nr:hypothetical protein EHQ69_17965 [Leptospira congkakensis]TGL88934.1 hypothetical protein EHQ68_09370 [Leptospira congkakensis]TGL93438.1 hypothetical protein EHQ70_17535 [Leptospira congkakensis]
MVSLLGLVSPAAEGNRETGQDSGFGSEDVFSIESVSPTVVLENSNFTIVGKNLENVTEKQLFGDDHSKFLKFTEVGNTKITVSVEFCSDSHFFVPSSGNKENNHQISISCLGPFRYPIHSAKFDLGVAITPISPNFSENSLKILKSLGEIKFALESKLPDGILLDANTGEISGIPTETTGNEFRSYKVFAESKSNPYLKIQSHVRMIVLTVEEKINRTCRAFVETSTCRGPSPHRCSNSSVCYMSQFACGIDPKCGFLESPNASD